MIYRLVAICNVRQNLFFVLVLMFILCRFYNRMKSWKSHAWAYPRSWWDMIDGQRNWNSSVQHSRRRSNQHTYLNSDNRSRQIANIWFSSTHPPHQPTTNKPENFADSLLSLDFVESFMMIFEMYKTHSLSRVCFLCNGTHTAFAPPTYSNRFIGWLWCGKTMKIIEKKFIPNEY